MKSWGIDFMGCLEQNNILDVCKLCRNQKLSIDQEYCRDCMIRERLTNKILQNNV